MPPEAYATLVRTEDDVVGALVLGASLKETLTRRPLICMTAGDAIGAGSRTQLARVYDEIRQVDGQCGRLAAWSLECVGKVVFVDHDLLVLRNLDDLFERPELTASPDPTWPDAPHPGLFVASPSARIYDNMCVRKLRMGIGDDADSSPEQALLDEFFPQWRNADARRLSCTDVLFTPLADANPAMYARHRESVRAVRFSVRPWHEIEPDDEAGHPSTLAADIYRRRWWETFHRCKHAWQSARSELLSPSSQASPYTLLAASYPTAPPSLVAERAKFVEAELTWIDGQLQALEAEMEANSERHSDLVSRRVCMYNELGPLRVQLEIAERAEREDRIIARSLADQLVETVVRVLMCQAQPGETCIVHF